MSPEAVETDLLAAIAAEPDAIEPRLIYADWLQARNDPRGELIVIQAKLRERPDDAVLRAREKELTEALTKNVLESVPGKPLPPEVVANWYAGFIDSLNLSIRTIRELRTTRKALLERPELAQVREIDIDSK